MSFPRCLNTQGQNHLGGYTLYVCECCPYGYHIDLDFVRYCETINQDTERTASLKRRKDRRRQRQSMEVLLGITTSPQDSTDHNYKTLPALKSPQIFEKHSRLLSKQDSFDNAVSDFEQTLQRSKHKLSNNLPDVTAVTANVNRTNALSTISSSSGTNMLCLQRPENYETAYREAAINEPYGLSPAAFRKIREQMALSLERTRELEEQIKQLPELQAQILTLKDDNKRLLTKLKSEENLKSRLMTTNFAYTCPRLSRSYSFTEIGSLENHTKEPPPPPPRKDFGVNCGVLTRTVGVGHQSPLTRNVSTFTSGKEFDGFSDKWLSEKYQFMNSLAPNQMKNIEATAKPIEKRTINTQTMPHTVSDKHIQTLDSQKHYQTKSVTASPSSLDFSVQKDVEVYNVGVSDDTISDIGCEKCCVLKISTAVGADNNDNLHLTPISLSSLSFPRSKSFSLGEDKLNLNIKSRSVASQYKTSNSTKASQYDIKGICRSSQCDVKSHSKGSQYELKHVEKHTQYENYNVSRNTDTKDLIMSNNNNVACQTKGTNYLDTIDVGCNTAEVFETVTTCEKCHKKDKERLKRDPSPNTSKIPRPQLLSPFENRKFKRQDTYTRIPAEKSPISPGGSGSNFFPSETSPYIDSSFETTKETLQLPEVTISNDEHGDDISPTNEINIQESSLPYSHSTLHTTSQKEHQKAIPSKEMLAAMKVLNDSLSKHPSKNTNNQNAIDIIRQEWFKISSFATADPLDVEDYLDAFEDVSSLLLNYIVNMKDGSGNTAMHYAVSLGNFDVVSILLDSKVCDINKPNTAGYTSVMLVSLAQIRSETHGNVVKKLFEMSDVNIRAKQHGQTALMLAVSHGRLDMVKMLLDAGADINIQDDDGSTALMCAAEHGHIEIVKHFLSRPDCDSTIIDVDGSSALKIAMEASHRPIGVLLYAHERNLCVSHGMPKHKKKSVSPGMPSSPLPLRSSTRALTDVKYSK